MAKRSFGSHRKKATGAIQRRGRAKGYSLRILAKKLGVPFKRGK